MRALAQSNSGFFLTGGGVLVGFVLGHRATDDLDLFTTDDASMGRLTTWLTRLASPSARSWNRFRRRQTIAATYSHAAARARAWTSCETVGLSCLLIRFKSVRFKLLDRQ